MQTQQIQALTFSILFWLDDISNTLGRYHPTFNKDAGQEKAFRLVFSNVKNALEKYKFLLDHTNFFDLEGVGSILVQEIKYHIQEINCHKSKTLAPVDDANGHIKDNFLEQFTGELEKLSKLIAPELSSVSSESASRISQSDFFGGWSLADFQVGKEHAIDISRLEEMVASLRGRLSRLVPPVSSSDNNKILLSTTKDISSWQKKVELAEMENNNWTGAMGVLREYLAHQKSILPSDPVHINFVHQRMSILLSIRDGKSKSLVPALKRAGFLLKQESNGYALVNPYLAAKYLLVKFLKENTNKYGDHTVKITSPEDEMAVKRLILSGIAMEKTIERIQEQLSSAKIYTRSDLLAVGLKGFFEELPNNLVFLSQKPSGFFSATVSDYIIAVLTPVPSAASSSSLPNVVANTNAKNLTVSSPVPSAASSSAAVSSVASTLLSFPLRIASHSLPDLINENINFGPDNHEKTLKQMGGTVFRNLSWEYFLEAIIEKYRDWLNIQEIMGQLDETIKKIVFCCQHTVDKLVRMLPSNLDPIKLILGCLLKELIEEVLNSPQKPLFFFLDDKQGIVLSIQKQLINFHYMLVNEIPLSVLPVLLKELAEGFYGIKRFFSYHCSQTFIGPRFHPDPNFTEKMSENNKSALSLMFSRYGMSEFITGLAGSKKSVSVQFVLSLRSKSQQELEWSDEELMNRYCKDLPSAHYSMAKSTGTVELYVTAPPRKMDSILPLLLENAKKIDRAHGEQLLGIKREFDLFFKESYTLSLDFLDSDSKLTINKVTLLRLNNGAIKVGLNRNANLTDQQKTIFEKYLIFFVLLRHYLSLPFDDDKDTFSITIPREKIPYFFRILPNFAFSSFVYPKDSSVGTSQAVAKRLCLPLGIEKTETLGLLVESDETLGSFVRPDKDLSSPMFDCGYGFSSCYTDSNTLNQIQTALKKNNLTMQLVQTFLVNLSWSFLRSGSATFLYKNFIAELNFAILLGIYCPVLVRTYSPTQKLWAEQLQRILEASREISREQYPLLIAELSKHSTTSEASAIKTLMSVLHLPETIAELGISELLSSNSSSLAAASSPIPSRPSPSP